MNAPKVTLQAESCSSLWPELNEHMSDQGTQQTSNHLSLPLAANSRQPLNSRHQLRNTHFYQNQSTSIILTVGCNPIQSQASSSQQVVGLMLKFLLPENSSPSASPAPNPQPPVAPLRGRVALGVAVGHAKEVPQLLLVFWLLQCDNSQGKHHLIQLQAKHRQHNNHLLPQQNQTRGCRGCIWHMSSKVWVAFLCYRKKSSP